MLEQLHTRRQKANFNPRNTPDSENQLKRDHALNIKLSEAITGENLQDLELSADTKMTM